MCGGFSCAPLLGTWLTTQARHMSWVGIKPATFWFTGQQSIHWATPARAQYSIFEWKLAKTFPECVIFICNFVMREENSFIHQNFVIGAMGRGYNRFIGRTESKYKLDLPSKGLSPNKSGNHLNFSGSPLCYVYNLKTGLGTFWGHFCDSKTPASHIQPLQNTTLK